jgi:spore maturation protein A
MSFIWFALILISVIFGVFSGSIEAVSAAALDGAKEAVTLAISITGVICLWNGVLEVMKRCGLARSLSKLTSPLLSRLFRQTAKNSEAFEAISANFSANLLGLGNAATPFGIKAAQCMSSGEEASDDLCMLVVMNTASIQIIPATVAALRSSLGSTAPFDILPAVWLTSLLALTAGVLAAKLMSKSGGAKQRHSPKSI